MNNSLNPLVSVVVPCYNMESKAYRLFNSLLSQTYKNLQIILVNDGSTDNTEKLVLDYITKFEAEGYKCKYIYQDNAGPGAALENGLSYVEGNYLTWPDADDYMSDDSIEKKLKFLLEHDDYAFVKSDANLYLNTDLEHSLGFISKKSPNRFKETDLMTDYILENDVYFCPICFMIRFDYYKKVNPSLYIYHGRKGQNYQMILPLAYAGYKFGYIDESLGSYLIYEGSVSHQGEKSFEQLCKGYEDLQNIIVYTLDNMFMKAEDKAHYKQLAIEKFNYYKCLRAFEYGIKNEYCRNRSNIISGMFKNKLVKPDLYVKIPYGFLCHSYLIKVIKQIKSLIKTNKNIYRFIYKIK